MFSGSLVAIVTPFRNGKVDERAFGDLIEWQIANGTNGIVPCGTTGESATLTHDEHHRVIRLTVEVVKGRVPVIAGTGSNSTDEAISLTRHAKEAGADGALLITPYYNKPTQEGLYRHYKAVAEAVDHSSGALQHSRPHRSQHVAGDGRASCGDEKYRRSQGRAAAPSSRPPTLHRPAVIA